MATFTLELHDFHVSEKYGFMLENPVEVLPKYFQPWNDLAKHLPVLVTNKQMRERVHKLELLDHARLLEYKELRLAHLQLCLIASGYIWQDGDDAVTQVLPKSVAVPLSAVSEKLGMQPVLSHPSLVLANWKLKDPDKPIGLGNLKCLYELPPGGPEVDWFIIVTANVEFVFAQAVKHILGALDYAEQGDADKLLTSLEEIISIVRNMITALSKMHEKLSGETFYNGMRPYLQGWGGATSPLPHGLIYEGISEKPIQMIGGSAAQSSTMQTLDAALGIQHEEDKQGFLHKMREYMPPAHKNFIDTIAQKSLIKHFVDKSNCDKLTSTYNNCVTAVADFRSYHIQLVTKYIVIMSSKESRNKNFEAVSKVGTGGSSVIPFLKSLRESTKDSFFLGADSKAKGDGRLVNGNKSAENDTGGHD